MRKSLIKAALSFKDIIIAADNVTGDFNLNLPFHKDLINIPETQTRMVGFDLNGEYWGRCFFPTSALEQYRMHLEIIKNTGFEYINCRITCCHDSWSPHFNILPSNKEFYLKNVDQLHHIMENVSVKFPNTMRSYKYCSHVKTHKFKYIPDG